MDKTLRINQDVLKKVTDVLGFKPGWVRRSVYETLHRPRPPKRRGSHVLAWRTFGETRERRVNGRYLTRYHNECFWLSRQDLLGGESPYVRDRYLPPHCPYEAVPWPPKGMGLGK